MEEGADLVVGEVLAGEKLLQKVGYGKRSHGRHLFVREINVTTTGSVVGSTSAPLVATPLRYRTCLRRVMGFATLPMLGPPLVEDALDPLVLLRADHNVSRIRVRVNELGMARLFDGLADFGADNGHDSSKTESTRLRCLAQSSSLLGVEVKNSA